MAVWVMGVGDGSVGGGGEVHNPGPMRKLGRTGPSEVHQHVYEKKKPVTLLTSTTESHRRTHVAHQPLLPPHM